VIRKETDLIDENGIKSFERYYWNSDKNQLEGRENTVTIPLNNEHQSTRIIYKVWVPRFQNWKDTIACNIIRVGEDKGYIYEKYDEVNHRWQYDRKVEYINHVKGTTLTQSNWNGNDWDFDSRIVYDEKEDTLYKYRSVIYAYNMPEKGWNPVYLYSEMKEKSESFYQKWDAHQKKWTNYLLSKGEGWYANHYLWDEGTKKYHKKDYYDIINIMRSVEEEFDKIKVDTRYYDIIELPYIELH
jgi:hypothetical protein